MAGGVRISMLSGAQGAERRSFNEAQEWLKSLELDGLIQCAPGSDIDSLHLNLRRELQVQPWFQASDTLDLCTLFPLSGRKSDLDREIVLAMVAAPMPIMFPSLDEFYANIRVRRHIVKTARLAELRFDPAAVDRPAAYWTYDEDRGFLLNEAASLIDALEAALIPNETGRKYSFSCYRASEYVMLHGIALELKRTRPDRLTALEARWRTHPIASRRFHDAFVHEVGSVQAPIPAGFYIPGDRIWFRNPDEASADVSGYEGSWVIYLGNGLFSNFWNRRAPFDLRSKCLEIYCWRDALRMNTDGEPFIDEIRVAELVAQIIRGSDQEQAILQRMMKYRDVSGSYGDGGCIDSTREFINFFSEGEPSLQF